MKFASYITGAAALASSVAAGPVKKRAAYTDADILNYALTLEHLEDKFYREGLANFTAADFAKAGHGETFYENLKEISFDETTHVSFLTSALKAAGAPAVAECTYAFGVTDVDSFLATASILEGVGVTAYLGAAASITTGAYLTAAGSILTVEARHNAYLRRVIGERPYPQSFDVPLDFDEVYTLAAPFIVSCPSDNPTFLPLKAFPALTVKSNGKVLTGSTITASADLKGWGGSVTAFFVTVTGPVSAPITSSGKGSYTITVPAGIHGQSYLVLTKNATTVSDDTIVAGPAIVEISGTDGAPTLV